MDSHQVREAWASRSGEYSPAYYAYHGPDARSEAVLEAIEPFLGPNPAILEVGCSAGRHLAHLHEAGYSDLHGVEVNEAAAAAMEEAFPALAERVHVEYAAIEDVVSAYATGRFDVVYSIETLQHLHPDSTWVFAELSRITEDLLVTVENEQPDSEAKPVNEESSSPESNDRSVTISTPTDDSFPLYYRDFGSIFADIGLEQVAVDRDDRDTIRVFRHPAP
ncbi:MAG: class I SAM-dependent methyltransferase [Halodesulfurarchaeum sp.]